ncbi:MAG: S41 family peptidase [Clostridia bacterium]|nr:S41 family peptidase [Clostridia bacterium]
MYIKKSVLIICAAVLIMAVSIGTIMIVNPFGALQFDDLIKFNTGVAVLNRYYYEDVDSDLLLDGALAGVSYSVEDPYTVYMDKETAESFMESVESDDYTGVGLYISNDSEDNRVTVVSPLSGSPAEKAGLVSGDKILEVDGTSVLGENIDEVAAKMKGKEGTDVKLKVLKKSSGETVEITITRATIKRETVTSKMIDDKIGYIQVTQFGVNTFTEFAEAFNGLLEKNMRKVVIDLRNNPGGYVDVAVRIADSFLDGDKEIVYTLDKYGKKRDYTATEGISKLPIVLLTNGGSASASEILVGALKDYDLATVVGEKTFGKGVTQIPYEFFDGSIMKITDSRYYTPSGACIDKQGIEPDVTVKMSDEKYSRLSELTPMEDEQLKKAIEILQSK